MDFNYYDDRSLFKPYDFFSTKLSKNTEASAPDRLDILVRLYSIPQQETRRFWAVETYINDRPNLVSALHNVAIDAAGFKKDLLKPNPSELRQNFYQHASKLLGATRDALIDRGWLQMNGEPILHLRQGPRVPKTFTDPGAGVKSSISFSYQFAPSVLTENWSMTFPIVIKPTPPVQAPKSAPRKRARLLVPA